MKALLLALLLFAFSPVFAEEPATKTNYKMVNQDGAALQLDDFKKDYVLLSFIFTRCPMPQMCPRNFRQSYELAEKWKSLSWFQTGGKKLKILAVTLDPEFDTPPVLKGHMEKQNLDPSIVTLATGEPQALSDFAGEFNVIGFPSEGTITHNMKTVLLGPGLIPIAEYKDNNWTPDEIIQKVVGTDSPTRWILATLIPLFFVMGMLARRSMARRRVSRN